MLHDTNIDFLKDICKTGILPKSKQAKNATYLPSAQKQTANLSNGGQSSNLAKYCINVDWFECTLEGNWLPLSADTEAGEMITLLGGDLVLQRPQKIGNKEEKGRNGTKFYKYLYRIFFHGEMVGQISTHPRNAIMGNTSGDQGTRDLSQLKLDNHLLYRKDWLDIFHAIRKGLGVELNNVTRLDIAIDGAGFIDDYRKTVGEHAIYDIVGKAKDTSGREKVEVGKGVNESGKEVSKRRRQVTHFYIGSKSSIKYAKGYRKDEEIRQKSQKTYIMETWDRANLEAWNGGKGKVERLEITLKAKAIANIKDFDINSLSDSGYLAGVMRESLRRFYQFVELEELEAKGENVSKCKVIDAVDWSAFDCVDVERVSTTKKPNIIWGLQRRVSFDMEERAAKLDKTQKDLFSQIFYYNRELCKSYGIVDWFDRQIPKWERHREYHEALRDARRLARYRQKVA